MMTDLGLSLNVLRWVAIAALGLGGGMFVYILLDTLGWLAQRILSNRRQSWRSLSYYYAKSVESQITPEQVYGIAHLNWPLICVLAGGAGVVVTWALYGERPGPGMFLGVVGAALPILYRRNLITQAQQCIQQQVRTFITDLRLGLQIGGSLGPTLDRLAEQGGEGILYTRLRLHARTLLRANATPVEVIKQLADELQSRELRELLVRLHAAQRGVETFEHALTVGADEVIAQMTASVEQTIEGATTRLMVPTLLLTVMPLLVLALYPVAARIVEGLTGTGLF